MKLKRLVEQGETSAQFYDLGKDFSSFTHTMDATEEQIKAKFEAAIGSKLKGKKIRARASRGYKQFEKDYEVNVANVSLDDYYDNYVVVVKDTNGKEYFLKPGFKVQIEGQAEAPKPEPPKQFPPKPTPQPTQPAPAPPTQAPAQAAPEPVKEDANQVRKYPVEQIIQDVSAWLPALLVHPPTTLKHYVPRDGVERVEGGKHMISYGVTVPLDDVPALTVDQIKQALSGASRMAGDKGDIDSFYKLEKFEVRGGKYVIIIKKITNY